MSVGFGAATHQGLVRPTNEDSYLTVPPVFLVADGMGGHSQGEVASQTVVDAFLGFSTRTWLTSDDLVDAVQRASNDINRLAGQGRSPGSTLSGVALTVQSGMPCWLVFNIGDSRTFLFRDDGLTQISVDHSAAVRAKAAGAPPVAQNVITRALGAGLALPVADQWLIPALQGDRVLVCSDGLTNEVSPELISATLMSFDDPQDVANSLVQAALNAGGRDNITVVVVDCTELVSTASYDLAAEDSTASDDADDTIPDEVEVN